jgi:HAD superfamily hydrolase (TIGR01509 family)
VLYDATVWRRWLYGLLKHLGLPHDYATLFGRWDRDYLDEVHRGGRDYQEAFVTFLSEVGLGRAEIDEVCAASAARRRAIAASLRPLPGVRATLERLRARGFALGVLSDSEDTAARLRERLQALGISAPLGALVSSFDLRRTKPAPQCYEAVLRAMGLTSGQAAFVGHDAEELRGAAAVGLRTIAFNHEPCARADLYLQRFEDLLEHVVSCDEGTAAAA